MRLALTVVMIVGIRSWVCRHKYDMTVAHASLRDDMVGKRLYLGTAPLEHGHFQTTIVADVNVERCLPEVVMIMKFLRQAFGKLAGRVIIDITQGRDAIAIMRHFQAGLL